MPWPLSVAFSPLSQLSMFLPKRLLVLPALMCGFWAAPAWADVSFFGSVSPDPPAGGGVFSSTTLVVGDDDDDVNSPLGYVEIDGGTDLQYDRLILGDEAEFIGDVVVTGSGTVLRLDDSSQSNQALQVGETGTGFLTISNGALVDVSDLSTNSGQNGSATLGQEATGAGFVTVEGRLSRLAVGDNLVVGEAGYGELIIRDQAFAYYTDPDDGTLTIGQTATGVGIATVDGAGTFWQLPQTISVGVTGTGTLRVTGGATADAANGFGGAFTVGSNGLVEVDNGRLLTDGVTITGRLQGDGLVTGPVTITSDTGEVTAGAGQKLQFTGAVANQGIVQVAGDETGRAEIEFTAAATNTDPGGVALPGRIAVADGTVRFNQALTNDGVLSSTSGVTDFHGDITNGVGGLIAIGGGSNATFFDDVNVTAGTLNIAAGSTALFLGDITISAGVTLGITVDGASQEVGFETPLQVSGLTTLNSPISLSLASGFVPEEGDTFELISAVGGLSVGVVDPNNFDPLPNGLLWDVQLSDDSVSAVVIGGGINPGGGVIDGDFNGDNVVDSADYAVWRNNLGQSGGGLPGDANGDGDVDADDLDIWRQNYGQIGSPLLGALTQVPEPSSLALGCILAAILGGVRTSRLQLA